MQKLIIITGDLAAGKSTLAAALAEELRIPFITKDRLKEIACDIFGFHDRLENRSLSESAISSMIYFFAQAAKVGQDLILEANFRSLELMKIKALAEENIYQVVLILLTGDLRLLYQRYLDRLPTRHIAHQVMSLEQSYEGFVAHIEDIRRENLIFTPHEINMSELDEDEVVNQALDIIYRELGQ